MLLDSQPARRTSWRSFEREGGGTIINDGDRPVSRIAIRVNALDVSGNVVRTVTTPPLSQTIDPFGGRATFETLMPRDRTVAGYHAVAIAR